MSSTSDALLPRRTCPRATLWPGGAKDGAKLAANATKIRLMPCAWLGRSVRAELFALGVVNEGRPRVGGEDQFRPVGVLGVADGDGFRQVGDLDACAIGAAVAALAPPGRPTLHGDAQR